MTEPLENGPAVRTGNSFKQSDPSPNVLDLVSAAIQRQDDLREQESAHIRELMALRAEYQAEIRSGEAERIDAIRAVDVGNVQRAAEVVAQQAITLQNQVTTSAEALRTQVAAAATAAATSLAAALEPIQKDIADLRRVQYEAAGVKAQTTETREVGGARANYVGTAIAVAFAVIALLGYQATRSTPAPVIVNPPAATSP